MDRERAVAVGPGLGALELTVRGGQREIDDQPAGQVDRAAVARADGDDGEHDAAVIEDTDVDFSTAATGTVKVALTRADTGSVTEVQENTKEDLLDFQTFFLELRSWDAPVGAQLTADVLRSRYMWRTQLTVGGYENIVTQLGSLPAVRYDGVSRRLSRKGEIDMSQGDRHYSIWVSDDADRVPLKMVAKTDYGDVLMEITDYAAGQGKRLGTTWGGGGGAKK